MSAARTWSFYDAATGAIAPGAMTCTSAQADANTPASHVAIEGRFDHLSQRVNLQTGQVEDYQPPAPADDALYTIARSVQEVDAVRKALKLDKIILYGHSCGAMLAIEYMIATGGAVVEKLMGVGFTRLRTRLNFKGNRYLAEKETWTDYPDLPA